MHALLLAPQSASQIDEDARLGHVGPQLCEVSPVLAELSEALARGWRHAIHFFSCQRGE
jgi:hypothetical protein